MRPSVGSHVTASPANEVRRTLEANRYGLARTLYVARLREESKLLLEELSRDHSDSIGYVEYLAAVDVRRGHGNRPCGPRHLSPSYSDRIRSRRSCFRHARFVAVLGDRDAAVEYLHRAYAEGRRFHYGDKFNVDLQGLRGYQPYHDWASPETARGKSL